MESQDIESAIADEDRRYAAWIAEARPLLAENKHAEALRLPSYPRLPVEGIPWAPLASPLGTATMALVSSAGIYRLDQEPFAAADPTGDVTWRAVEAATPRDQLGIAHDHYDHSAAMADLNSVFPVDRMRELAGDGVIGALHPTVYSFSGYMRDLWRWRREGAPGIARALADAGVRAALLVPV
ncbi:MAG TPA: glycine/sarcosine/betaine reductase selenoprotein B family protein [Chloroflexota bacterium]|nr:glycine/sarcosine/betaine reductase selenoprotein B family protein [Chloroflexota bacterium]